MFVVPMYMSNILIKEKKKDAFAKGKKKDAFANG